MKQISKRPMNWTALCSMLAVGVVLMSCSRADVEDRVHVIDPSTGEVGSGAIRAIAPPMTPGQPVQPGTTSSSATPAAGPGR
jgi:hypothetical protein